MRPFEQSWPRTRRVLRQFAHMDLIMERAGVDPALAARKAGGAAIAEARQICLSCSMDRACREWLKTSEGLSDPPEFCRNGSFFRDCMRRTG